MVKAPALWDISARKEVYDLLVALWPHLEEDARDTLVMRIAAGPPAWMSEHLTEADRDQLSARRIFERLRIMQRSDPERPHAAMEVELARLRETYPQWDIAPGDQAHFSFFSQSGWRAPDSVNDERRLEAMSASEIVEELATDQRDDALDDWRAMVASDWNKMIAVLRDVADRAGPDAELWTATLWGLRTKAATLTPGEDVLMLVAGMDDSLARDPSVSTAAAYLLESAASSAQFQEMPQENFWRAFDAVVQGVSQDETNSRTPDSSDWIAVAINTSMGNLALAFLNALFVRRPVVGGGIPADLRERCVHLLGNGEARHVLPAWFSPRVFPTSLRLIPASLACTCFPISGGSVTRPKLSQSGRALVGNHTSIHCYGTKSRPTSSPAFKRGESICWARPLARWPKPWPPQGSTSDLTICRAKSLRAQSAGWIRRRVRVCCTGL